MPMKIMDFFRIHYNQCMKDYLYIGLSLVFLAIFLRISFWGLYTTETRDITYDDDSLTYPDYSPGDNVRIHGPIYELEYYGKVEPDLPDERKLDNRQLDATTGIYLHGLQVMDNLTIKKSRISNITLSNLLIYDGDFTKVIFENLTFQNVSFIKTRFSNILFINVRFRNVSLIDCSMDECVFISVEFNQGYTRELEISQSIFDDTNFDEINFSMTEFNHLELSSCIFRSAHYSDTEFQGVRFDSCRWELNTFFNTSFDVVILNEHVMQGCDFKESKLQNIFQNHTDEFDFTMIRSKEVYARVKGDIMESYTEDTSIYGNLELRREEGKVEDETAEGMSYSYEIFVEKNIHHSLRIDGIFYIIIVGGFTIITYAYGGKTIIMALVKFFLPFVFSGIGILIYFLALPWDTFEKLGTWMILYFFPPLGKESVIPAAIAQGIHPLLIASAIAFIDIMVGLFLVWNFDLARKIPLIGSFIRRIESKGSDILVKKPWVERLAFTGIILFVMFPFQGSGAVGATIVGRMLGMDPKKVWYAVIIGAIVGCLIIAYTSAFAITFLLGIGLAYALLSIALVVIFLYIVYNYDKWGDWVKDHLQ